MRKRIILGTFVLACALGGCGGQSTSSPTSVSVNGNYSGTIQDSFYGAGSIQLTLSQTGGSLMGTYQDAFPAVGAASGGSLTGTVNNGVSLSATLTPGNPTICPFNLTGSITNGGAAISGTYSAFNCTGTETGTSSVTRQ
jgi:hypothetical protein